MVDNLYMRSTAFGSQSGSLPMGDFNMNVGVETINFVNSSKVLVIGAGGLGCEILKDLALSGFKDIHIVDLDTIDVSNLNRQFLFRIKDVGRKKAEVAAEFVQNRVKGVVVTPHTSPIQSFDESFFRQFNVIVAGLDNIKARRWINATLHEMVQYDENDEVIPESVIPFVDGGTEGFKGQARLIIPKVTSCFECSMDLFPPETRFQLCTVAETPRKPDHCIAYALFAVNRSLSNPEADAIRNDWDKTFGKDAKLDKDDPDHMRFLYERACARAQKYAIEGVTYSLTMGVVKNIIPAIASTNAIISAACVNEVVKVLTWCSQSLDSYFMYIGSAGNGIHTHTFPLEKRVGCPVCDPQTMKIECPKGATLQEFIDILRQNKELQLEQPSLTKTGASLFMQHPPSLREATKANLAKKMVELASEGQDTITVTDPVFPQSQSLQILIKYV